MKPEPQVFFFTPKENLFVCTVAKENLTSVQEILLWFQQTKGGLGMRQATKLVKGNLSRKTC